MLFGEVFAQHSLHGRLQFFECDPFSAVVEHRTDGLHTAEHFGQTAVFVGQWQGGVHCFGQGLVALVGWHRWRFGRAKEAFWRHFLLWRHDVVRVMFGGRAHAFLGAAMTKSWC